MKNVAQPNPEKYPSAGNTANLLMADFFHVAFDHAPDGMMIFGPGGNLLRVNAACLRLHNVGREEAFAIKNQEEYFEIYTLEGTRLPVNQWPHRRVLGGEDIANIKVMVVNKQKHSKFYGIIDGHAEKDAVGNLSLAIIFIRDITQQVLTRQELYSEMDKRKQQIDDIDLYRRQIKDDRELLKTVIDTIPIMVVIYDERVQKVTINRAVTEITGYTNHDFKFNSIMDLAYPDPEYRREVHGYMQSLKSGFKDIVMHTKDGRDIQTSWANVKLPGGRQVGVGIDISERKQLEQAMAEAMRRAEKENQVQHAFIQNISHEVRTPMNSILGFTELLQKRINGKPDADYLDSIIYNGRQLLRLIDDIVDFSRLDKKELTLVKSHVSVSQFIGQARLQIPGLKLKYRRDHLRVVVQEPAQQPFDIILHTDLHRLQQIITNLISNALKYTRKGSVVFGYTLRREKGDVVFYVKDTGIGIPREDHERVFMRFNRLHENIGEEFRGTGLGLAISQHLVQLLGGKIWFDSEPGRGSEFYFPHPFAELQEAHEEQPDTDSASSTSVPKLDAKTILIVEDDPFSFLMLQGMLLDTRATVVHAETGKDALEQFSDHPVDLVLLDIRLPGMSGYEVITKIKDINPHVPVIAQTANALSIDREKTRIAGFDDHVSKPISMERLYEMLNRFLG